jgi:hypothetical protein
MKREWHVGLANVGPPIPDAISVKNIIPKKRIDLLCVCFGNQAKQVGSMLFLVELNTF